jgi:hypothetical protein
VVGNCDIDVEQSRDRSQLSFSLTQRLVEHQAKRKRGIVTLTFVRQPEVHDEFAAHITLRFGHTYPPASH